VQATSNVLTALPSERWSLVGRDAELRALHRSVDEHRIVMVTGPGGIGKTRLVVALANDLARRGRRVGFVELADVLDAASVIDAIADQLAVEVVPGASRYDGLVHWLGVEPTVLIVDNLEHVIDAAPDLATLADECPRLHVLATSRRAADLPNERVVRLEPLASTTANGAASAAGVQLLLERSEVDEASAPDVEAASLIVAGVGGLPLAIELAAFRARALGLVTVHELLVDDLALDGFETVSATSDRHSSLRQCLQWTYRDLDERARAVFHTIGAFAGTFDLASLRWVFGARREAAAGLATLVEHHLVDRIDTGDGSTRYATIPPIREFARELMTKMPARDEVIDAHSQRYRDVAADIRATFERGSANAAFDAFDRERANLTTATSALHRAHRYDDAAALGCDLAQIAIETGREDQVTEWFSDLVRRADDEGLPLRHEARVWAAYGELRLQTPGTAAQALAAMDDAIARARTAGDELAVLRGLERTTLAILAHGDIARSISASAEGIEIAKQRQLRRPLVQLMTLHAMLLHIAGDLAAACRFGFDALRVARGLDDARLVVRIGLLFAPMARTPEIDAEQVPSLRACLELARASGSVIDEMYVTMQLAVRAGFDGQPEFFEVVRHGLELADRTRSHGGELVFVLALAGAAFSNGDTRVGLTLDRALRPEWPALATVIPSAALHHYERIVEKHRPTDANGRDGLASDSDVTLWSEALVVARRYAATGASHRSDTQDLPRLSDREREVLEQLAAGHTNKEIAHALGLRPKTVMHHCASIYRKLGVRGRAEAAATALRTGLLTVDR
jgi:predicted ATPase/DNA-binding CsgD family transcriptional regulator